MKMALGTKLTTGLSLTPQMQQAIRLLQLSSLELEQEVQQKLDNNPLLERVEQDEFGNDIDNDFDADFDANYENDFSNTGQDFGKDDFSQDDVSDFSNVDKGANDFENHDNYVETFDNWQKNSLSKLSQSDTSDESNQDSDYQEYGNDAVDSSEHFASDNLEMSIDTEWDQVYIHEPTGLSQVDADELDDDYKFSTQGNIQDHVRWQLNFKHLSDIEMVIAEYLIDSMDDRGFIHLPTEELFHSLDMMLSFYQIDEVEITPEDIEVVIKQIQSCEPLGVGARGLPECLLLQLNRLPKHTENLENAKKLLSYPEFFISNNINALLKETGLNIEDIQPALTLIRTLDPNPALAYQQSQSQFDFAPESYDIPDILVAQNKDGWQVSLNPDTLPKLRVNQDYANLIKRNDESEQNLYLRENLYDARLFIRSIEERNQNLLKVASCIVKRQQGFFDHGATAMQPMILKDVADEVGLHESTVSRITTSKTMLTPKGLFNLKYFFSSHVMSEDGEGVSSTAISAMIEQMIDDEDPKKPLSDNTIVENLKAQGIDIARRTVTKYREAMNIGSSTQRKQRF
ncbi:RNA polymerase factor sigma-54 [Faucicola boevrei]|uniref:RNA polymerase factor sigma-54 n=1 Tax=Faucicola boevrei TaxID=346665 RepID=UPI00036E49A5|nr:RNA polymerase factor sigma-54 [Moraxella boevrei]